MTERSWIDIDPDIGTERPDIADAVNGAVAYVEESRTELKFQTLPRPEVEAGLAADFQWWHGLIVVALPDGFDSLDFDQQFDVAVSLIETSLAEHSAKKQPAD